MAALKLVLGGVFAFKSKIEGLNPIRAVELPITKYFGGKSFFENSFNFKIFASCIVFQLVIGGPSKGELIRSIDSSKNIEVKIPNAK